ncbi:TetR/AcrR family transcriptional regulator [Streptomyces kanamyceticus]|uniref:TetR/AcrR family transcriptional regulator n=1 Tax=Streptomyces kanamyceticus TaxID=1967 RepID=A0A5J6GH64_STRKN|nr:TetR/AcrR family transcriptional regulator [Streptomyces kanamyceticus]QEU93814.1 TetR/AcrR family transcriptional regulator [Streptomyces kanamyceticus]
MTEAATTRRSRITPEREAELYEAVLDLLREVGYEALTMDAVAARTRSSKATLYRQWGSKPELIAKALRHNKPTSLDEIDTGSLRGDIHAMMARSDDCQMDRDAALMRGLFHAIHGNAELHQALRQLLIEPELDHLNTLLRRAVDRGEVAADNPALDFVIHMLVGGFVARDLIEDRTVDREFLTSYIDAVILPALGI